MIRNRLILFIALLLPLTSLAETPPGAGAITVDAVRQSVGHLASDALEGRGSGANGGRLAGDWLAENVKALGLQPGGDDGTFFQNFKGQGQNMRNVIATIPGREPGEMVVIGAHYDHLGLGHQSGSLEFGRGKGKIHNGADDNASGTAAILEIARAFKASGIQPRRRVVFIWFDGEERGLLGSNHFVKQPTFEDRAVLMVNLDMVGRLKDGVTVYGAPTGGDVLKGWIGKANEDLGLKLKLLETINANSDHSPFYKNGTPVFVPFTGLHGDYHRPSDDVGDVNNEGIAKIAQLSYAVAAQAAEADQTAPYVKVRDGTLESVMEQFQAMFGREDGKGIDMSKAMEQLREMFGRGRDRDGNRGDPGRTQRRERPRLGVTVQEGETSVAVQSVQPDSIAAKAGLQEGDVIVSFDGANVSSLAELRDLIASAKGDTEVVVSRSEELVTLIAPFPGAKPVPAQPDGPRWF